MSNLVWDVLPMAVHAIFLILAAVYVAGSILLLYDICRLS